ncbi:diacylglycerol/lipid kinase family protein [Subtercola endophyticus]|uniref:diacylglycerol/lipid kinase family protein n=1 Tax=Subtercola endophyticus TaxID=2895559 RepID=UPI001E34CFD4|nr:diacylglycerol kinase family protein [Subtercola endophyticus]UFS57483.1 NAD(+)/NADH kinase [Subtercola endophyticus]
MTDSPAKVAAIVYNPIKVDLAVLRKNVETEAAAAGWGETLWFETTVDDSGQGVTKQALERNVDLVIAAGGDGTVRAVAEGMHGSGTPLALLPSGTGNLLARNLKLTLNDMPVSVRTAFVGDDRPIDLGLIDIERTDTTRDRHVFVVMAGMGIDAKMIENTNDDLKKKAGWIAYIGAVVVSLRDKRELHLRYTLDGVKGRRHTANTIIIGNCGSLPGNILLLPDAVVDDGLLDVLVIRPAGFFGWVRVWTKVAIINRGRGGASGGDTAGQDPAPRNRNDPELRYRTGKRLVVRLSRPELIEIDGDTLGEATAFNAWVEPGGLTVRVPATLPA